MRNQHTAANLLELTKGTGSTQNINTNSSHILRLSPSNQKEKLCDPVLFRWLLLGLIEIPLQEKVIQTRWMLLRGLEWLSYFPDHLLPITKIYDSKDFYFRNTIWFTSVKNMFNLQMCDVQRYILFQRIHIGKLSIIPKLCLKALNLGGIKGPSAFFNPSSLRQ